MGLSVFAQLDSAWISSAYSGLNSVSDGIQSASDAFGQSAVNDALAAFSYEADFVSSVSTPPVTDSFDLALFADTWEPALTKAIQDPNLDIKANLNSFSQNVSGDQGIATTLLGRQGFLTEIFPALFSPINPDQMPQPGGDVMINPQPLPPGGLEFQPGSDVMINPQPLPPGSDVMINPQPLPPGAVSQNQLLLSQPQALRVQNDFSTIDVSVSRLNVATSAEDKQLALSSLLMNVFKLQDMEGVLKQTLAAYSSIPRTF